MYIIVRFFLSKRLTASTCYREYVILKNTLLNKQMLKLFYLNQFLKLYIIYFVKILMVNNYYDLGFYEIIQDLEPRINFNDNIFLSKWYLGTNHIIRH